MIVLGSINSQFYRDSGLWLERFGCFTWFPSRSVSFPVGMVKYRVSLINGTLGQFLQFFLWFSDKTLMLSSFLDHETPKDTSHV